MTQALSKIITLEQFLQQPETQPAQEYINGNIYPKPMPQGQHSTIQGELVTIINHGMKKTKIAWAFPKLRCTFTDKSIVPDVAIFKWQNLPVNEDGTISNKFLLPPDWTIEILSPNQSESLVTKKIVHCLTNGTEMGWLIDPNQKLIFTYTSNSHPLYFELESDLIPVPEFATDLEITLGDIFSWLKV
ncbi:MAG: Uma2 family endonuclease [Cyanobacterium sp.]